MSKQSKTSTAAHKPHTLWTLEVCRYLEMLMCLMCPAAYSGISALCIS